MLLQLYFNALAILFYRFNNSAFLYLLLRHTKNRAKVQKKNQPCKFLQTFLYYFLIFPLFASSIPNFQSPISNPQSSILNLQSSISNLQSSIFNLQSSILNLQSSIFNPQSSISNLHFFWLSTFSITAKRRQKDGKNTATKAATSLPIDPFSPPADKRQRCQKTQK